MQAKGLMKWSATIQEDKKKWNFLKRDFRRVKLKKSNSIPLSRIWVQLERKVRIHKDHSENSIKELWATNKELIKKNKIENKLRIE